MVEVWLPIEASPKYEISSEGRVVNRRTNRIIVSVPDSSGYYFVGLSTNGHRTYHRVHRLVMEAFCPTLSPELSVNHIDRDKSNNAIWNLEWITHQENMKHASETGFRNRGRGRNEVRIVETGQTFPSLSACARHIGGERRGILRCVIGQSETYRGYHFEYVW